MEREGRRGGGRGNKEVTVSEETCYLARSEYTTADVTDSSLGQNTLLQMLLISRSVRVHYCRCY